MTLNDSATNFSLSSHIDEVVMNGTVSSPSTDGIGSSQSSKYHNYVRIFLFCILFCIGAPLNLFFYWNLRGQYQPWDRLKRQIMLADLFILFFYLFSKICWHITYAWHGGVILCKLIKFTHEFSFQFSSITLAINALHKLSTLYYPFKVLKSPTKRVSVLICASWVYSCVWSVPNLYWFTVGTVPGRGFQQCSHKAQFWRAAGQFSDYQVLKDLVTVTNVVHLVTVFWFPLALMTIAYTFIATFVWTHYSLNAQVNEQRRSTDSGIIIDSTSDLTNSELDNGDKTSFVFTGAFDYNTTTVLFNNDEHEETNDPSVTFNHHPIQTIEMGSSDGGNEYIEAEEAEEEEEEEKGGVEMMTENGGKVMSTRKEKIRKDHERKTKVRMRTIKISLLLVICYVVCWGPYHMITILGYVDYGFYRQHRKLLKHLQNAILLIVIINPFVYGLCVRKNPFQTFFRLQMISSICERLKQVLFTKTS